MVQHLFRSHGARFILLITWLIFTLVLIHENNYLTKVSLNRWNSFFFSASDPMENEEDFQDAVLYNRDEWALDDVNVAQGPLLLGLETGGPIMYNKSCAKYPKLSSMRFSNVHWQRQDAGTEEYYLFSAYLDMRVSSVNISQCENVTVRILGMANLPRLTIANSSLKACQYWFEEQEKPVFGNVSAVQMLWPFNFSPNSRTFPYLITCEFPIGLSQKLPFSVSLAPTMCSHATNSLKIVHTDRANSRIEPSGFAVCVKALDFPSAKMRDRLMEWIEALRLLGADKIFMYEYFIHPEVKKALDYYENNGIIGVTQTELPADYPNHAQVRHLLIHTHIWDKRMTELIAYNDCLFKNMYDYEYIAVLDVDEIFMPYEHISWMELINQVKDVDIGPEAFAKKPVTSFCFQNHLYFDEMLKGNEDVVSSIPPEFYMLRHIYRGSEPTYGKALKCIHDTRETVGIHNHFAFLCRNKKGCVRHNVKLARGHMNHYRSFCSKEALNCSDFVFNSVEDFKLWRYKDEIIKNFGIVAEALNLESQ